MRSDPDANPVPAVATEPLDLPALLDAVPASSFITDAQGSILIANAKSADYFGADADKLAGRSLFERLPAPAANAFRTRFETAVTSGAQCDWEDEYGQKIYRHALVPIPGRNGAALRVAFFIEDITLRKKDEAAVRARERHYRFMLENSADTFWELDAQMRFTFISASDKRERGYEPEEVIGQSILSMLTPASQEQVKRAMMTRQALESRGEVTGPVRHEVEIKKKDGTTIWTEAHAVPYRDAGGAIIGFHGATRNTTERKRYEIALEQANHKLQAQVEEISALKTRLEEKANRDFLTGLHNRRYLDETLPRELARAKRDRYPLSLILVDLDHFKHVNDAYGHAAGDEALKTLSSILQREARASDIICRYGGEEFLIVLPNMSRAIALARAESWRAALDATPVKYDRCRISLTLSAGVAAYPDNGMDIERLLRLVDEALYQAKNGGRNRVDSIEPDEGAMERRHTMISLNWKQGYACGHPLIDAEHRELFRLANGVLELTMDEEATKENFTAAFDALLSHVAEHFAHEETILGTHEYDKLTEHSQAHRQLIGRATQLRQQAEESGIAIGQLIDFLVNDVIVGHMLKADRDFYPLFADTSAAPSQRVTK